MILDIILGFLQCGPSEGAGKVLQFPTQKNDQVNVDFSFREASCSWSFPAIAKSCVSGDSAVLDTTWGKGRTEAEPPSRPSCMAWEIGSSVGVHIFLLTVHSVLDITVHSEMYNWTCVKPTKRTWWLRGVTAWWVLLYILCNCLVTGVQQ